MLGITELPGGMRIQIMATFLVASASEFSYTVQNDEGVAIPPSADRPVRTPKGVLPPRVLAVYLEPGQGPCENTFAPRAVYQNGNR